MAAAGLSARRTTQVGLFALLAVGTVVAAVAAADVGMYTAGVAAARPCNGSIAWCLAGEVELEMDSEVNRRSLQVVRRNYISKQAIKQPQGPAVAARSGQRYGRGCERYNRCRGASFRPP